MGRDVTISGGLSIAKYLTGGSELYPPDANTWLDYVSQVVKPSLEQVRVLEIECSLSFVEEVMSVLQKVEEHLRLRNFLTGHAMTIADVFMAIVVSEVLWSATANKFIDKHFVNANLSNLNRFATIVFERAGLSKE